MRYELYRECQISAPLTPKIITHDNTFRKKPLLLLGYRIALPLKKRQ